MPPAASTPRRARGHVLAADVARHRLAARLSRAVRALPEEPPTPTLVVDLDAFDLNADDLARRAGGKPIRVATKSLRVPALIRRALSRPGFDGVLAYSLREALWLAGEGSCDDVVMGYPSADRAAFTRLLADPDLASRITLMVDDVAQLDLVDSLRGPVDVSVRVAVDVDAGLRVGPTHLGPLRSPLVSARDVLALVATIQGRPGFVLDGVMTYEGQVAGVADDVPGARSVVVRRMKAASVRQLLKRRAEIAQALSVADGVAGGRRLRFWNAGGSGSLETSSADPSVTELTAGSGLLVPHQFDHNRSFEPRPAAFFGLRVVRRPADDVVTLAGGGYLASGPAQADRAPLPWAPPGLELTGLEGAGEVQTPVRGPAAGLLEVGDLVWFRHAKSGEIAEHTDRVHLLAGDRIVETVPTYRGLGHAW